jgi:hypothetical protein
MKFISLRLVHKKQRETLFEAPCAWENGLTGEMGRDGHFLLLRVPTLARHRNEGDIVTGKHNSRIEII